MGLGIATHVAQVLLGLAHLYQGFMAPWAPGTEHVLVLPLTSAGFRRLEGALSPN
jgi:hypothetical protein